MFYYGALLPFELAVELHSQAVAAKLMNHDLTVINHESMKRGHVLAETGQVPMLVPWTLSLVTELLYTLTCQT